MVITGRCICHTDKLFSLAFFPKLPWLKLSRASNFKLFMPSRWCGNYFEDSGEKFFEKVLQCLFDTCLEADDNALEHGVSGRWDYLKVHLRSCKCCSLFFPERIQKFRLHSVSGNEYISMLCNLRYPPGPQKICWCYTRVATSKQTLGGPDG